MNQWLWSEYCHLVYTVPLQTGLMILGELSKGLMFSLFAVGDVCLASWTRHSFAMQKRKIVRFLNSAADSGRTCIKTTYQSIPVKVCVNFKLAISWWRGDHVGGGASSSRRGSWCWCSSSFHRSCSCLRWREGGGASGGSTNTVLSRGARSVSCGAEEQNEIMVITWCNIILTYLNQSLILIYRPIWVVEFQPCLHNKVLFINT